jgi:HD-like signal output (HDOD) protein
LKALWRHAVYNAAFMQLLADAQPKALKVKPGLAYLAGLLHNIGFLVLGHLFVRQFSLLGEALAADTDRSWLETEKRLLGADHTEIGVWLMRAWHMPPEVITTVFEHHNENYRGQHAVYANLALIANRMLRRRGIGDAPHDRLPVKLLAELKITEPQVTDIFKTLLESETSLEAIAREMASGV